MEALETITVTTPTVACDSGPLGHPKVYLHTGPDGTVVCPYCSRTFVLDEDASPAAAH